MQCNNNYNGRSIAESCVSKFNCDDKLLLAAAIFVKNVSFFHILSLPLSTAPDGPPTYFDLVVVNSTAIEALWELPAIGVRNGIIRGYKLFVQSSGRDIRNITIPNNETLAYIVGGLERATQYTLSVLAYTVADGPRSIHLTAVTLCKV